MCRARQKFPDAGRLLANQLKGNRWIRSSLNAKEEIIFSYGHFLMIFTTFDFNLEIIINRTNGALANIFRCDPRLARIIYILNCCLKRLLLMTVSTYLSIASFARKNTQVVRG